MPNYSNLYPHVGHLHNEGVEFVLGRITVNEVNPITKNAILNFTAEYMHTVTCCNEKKESGSSSRFYNQIRVVDFSDFLYELHHQMSTKTFDDWIGKAQVSVEHSALLKLLMTDEEVEVHGLNSIEGFPSYILANKLATRAASSPMPIQDRQVVGMVTSVAMESMSYAMNIERDETQMRKLQSMASKINYDQPQVPEANTLATPPGTKRGFKWLWKADLEGTLSGLVCGAIGGMVGGIAGTAIGGGLGALGGGVSNSIIKSIPAFR